MIQKSSVHNTTIDVNKLQMFKHGDLKKNQGPQQIGKTLGTKLVLNVVTECKGTFAL